MASRPGHVIQFGSGHPGEEGSAFFEADLFDSLQLGDVNVLFFPFHHMPPETGDMALFKRIYGSMTKGWIRSVQLMPPRWPQNSAEIFEWLEEAHVVVLGSGFPEPFIHLMKRMGLPQRFRVLHERGIHFLGYSAGSLALSVGYYLPFVGEDLLTQLSLLDHISMPESRRAEMERELRGCLEREDAEEFVEGIRARLAAEQELDEEQQAFMEEALWMEQAEGFALTPGITANPHYGEQFQYREIHLRHLSKMLPNLTHVGIPNGTALVSSTSPQGKRTVTFRGLNHRRKAAWIDGTGELRYLTDGDRVRG